MHYITFIDMILRFVISSDALFTNYLRCFELLDVGMSLVTWINLVKHFSLKIILL